jgi:RNA polymerase sigma factor (sigma-70 family)
MPSIEIYRVRIDPGDVERLMEIRAGAVAEFREQVPELLSADLVRLTDDVWLDILRWSDAVDPERIAAAAQCTPLSAEMHGLVAAELGHDRGELVHSFDLAWASPLEQLARAAAAGDSDALARLVEEVQHPVYRLALRFLGHPEDAKDATQEILVRLITHLGSFEGRLQFMTWAYSVAVRQLMRTRKRQIESSVRGAEAFAAFLDRGLAERDFTAEEAEYRLLCAEVRISCTYGMLLCLSRSLRASYILGDAMGKPDTVAAEICGISRAAHRQRLARARRTMRTIIADGCGLVDAANPCRCCRQIESSLAAGIMDRRHLPLATHPRSDTAPIETGTIERAAAQLDLALAMSEVYRSDPTFAAPREVWERVQAACPDLLA